MARSIETGDYAGETPQVIVKEFTVEQEDRSPLLRYPCRISQTSECRVNIAYHCQGQCADHVYP